MRGFREKPCQQEESPHTRNERMDAICHLPECERLGNWKPRSSVNRCDQLPRTLPVKGLPYPVLLLNCLSNREVHNCLYSSKWLSGPEGLRMWRKESFCIVEFWHSFHSVMNHLLQQVPDMTLPRQAKRVGGDNGFVLKSHAELTFSWRASSLQHKMKCGQMHRLTSLPYHWGSWCLCFPWPFEHLDLSLQGELAHDQ